MAAPGQSPTEVVAKGHAGLAAPSRAYVHGALAVAQFSWGSAAVTNKLGISGAGLSPLVFASIREVSAVPILLLLLSLSAGGGGGAGCAPPEGKGRGGRRLLVRLLPGFFIYTDQLCSLTGNMLANPLAAAAWQPSQVVFTMLISLCLGMEALTRWKAAALALTVAGALCLVLLPGGGSVGPGPGEARTNLGHALFFVNCMSSSLEVIIWRSLLRDVTEPLAHLAVMAESYMVAAVFMLSTAYAVSLSPAAIEFFCPDCNGRAWHVPHGALWAIAYSVVVQTTVGYCAQAWALRYADPSSAALYATAQPLVAAALTCALLLCGFNPGGVLAWPGLEMCGAVLIILGIVAHARGEARQRPGREPSNPELEAKAKARQQPGHEPSNPELEAQAQQQPGREPPNPERGAEAEAGAP